MDEEENDQEVPEVIQIETNEHYSENEGDDKIDQLDDILQKDRKRSRGR